jgi:hypothetical protein
MDNQRRNAERDGNYAAITQAAIHCGALMHLRQLRVEQGHTADGLLEPGCFYLAGGKRRSLSRSVEVYVVSVAKERVVVFLTKQRTFAEIPTLKAAMRDLPGMLIGNVDYVVTLETNKTPPGNHGSWYKIEVV